jgi:murein DD-endopeptidase MepM/ murein hydrolase activator NlpD
MSLSKTKDSDSQPSKRRSLMMKISLFYKPLMQKVCVFALIFALLASMPTEVNAGLFSSISGSSVEAAGKETELTDGAIHNSQTIPLLEASIDPDMKNMKETPTVIIVEEEALSPSDFFIGSGLESVSNGGITVYEVQKGDTLSQIAEDFDISVNTIRWENNISGQSIRVGQKLNILPVTGVKHTVKKGDTFVGIANKYDADLEDMLIFNGLSKGDPLKIGDIIFVPNGIIKTVASKPSTGSSGATYSNTKAPAGYYVRPATGRITSPYGSRRSGFHYGIDIGNKRGTPVVAAASGTVINVVSYCVEGKSSCGGRYGNYITIEHPNGTRTRYAHLGSVKVSVGQSVSQGQLIGTVGNTGRSTGPHLHFEVINSNGSTMRPPIY